MLPIIKKFKRNFYLVGGTAIALYIGHRRSIDFDLFTSKPFDKRIVENKLKDLGIKYKSLFQTKQEWTVLIRNTKITFYYFNFDIKPVNSFDNIIDIPSLLDLAAMKAFKIGELAKWKDYVDLYFIMSFYYPLKKVAKRAQQIFGSAFNEKLFREQIVYFDDIDYTEEIDFLIPNPDIEEIKNQLIQFALK